MSIEKMEQCLEDIRRIRIIDYPGFGVIEDFIEASINLHKDHIDRITELEVMLGECLGKEEICSCPKLKK